MENYLGKQVCINQQAMHHVVGACCSDHYYCTDPINRV